jgi:hypothetical protein
MPVGPAPVTTPDSGGNTGVIGPGASVLVNETAIDFSGDPVPVFTPQSFAVFKYTASATMDSLAPQIVHADASTGAITVTLPLVSSLQSQFVIIQKVDTSGNNVTVAKQAADDWFGSTTPLTLASQWKSVTLLPVRVEVVTTAPNTTTYGWQIITST